ncbi:PAS domain S-box protein [Aneurinibacillus sp. Ricciae_BoGa-3]|uniref:STAS domain-containing protein n=1 Tax=Aneurinibacillus sp. Ricciae_BoGa-3 TaxID=3022697 RepID=UPI00233FCC94|nr:STAS domain-containing protein [Aneurinibacillus sp. Ricciae_BoGa-3]WCK56259.1 PAS domain S-box protein [Aneurinibacillus sp. Ricciae_BoGa-3]
MVDLNQAGIELFKAPSKDAILGKSIFDSVPPDYLSLVKKRSQTVLELKKETELMEQQIKCYDGTIITVETNAVPIHYKDKTASQIVFRNITEKKQTEQALKDAVNELTKLPAPLLPISEKISILPLVRSIDTHRAQYILSSIPGKVAEQNFSILIIDFSGIHSLDTMVVDHLFKINHILRLLGVTSIITGLRPDLALTAVNLGIDLSSLQTFASVKQALKSFKFQSPTSRWLFLFLTSLSTNQCLNCWR